MPTDTRHNRSDLPSMAPRLSIIAVLAAGLAMVATGARAVADEPSAELRRNVAQHVSELASSLRAERVRAEQALLDLGPQILELLPAPDEAPDQATRIAVRQLRNRLERTVAEQSVQPSRVSLRGRLSVADFAAHVSEQTGNPLDLSRLSAASRERLIDVDFDGAPFWEALAALPESAHLAWEYAQESATIELLDSAVDVASRAAAAVNSGSFRITIEPLTRQRGTLRAVLQLQAEPRLRPLFVRIVEADFAAEAGGAALALFNPRAVTELPMTSRGPASFSVLFRAPEGVGSTATAVRGRVTVHVAAAPAEVRFTDLVAKRVVYLRRGGVSVTLKRTHVTTKPDGTRDLTAQLSVAYDDGGPEFESHRTWISHNEVRLEAADGTRHAADAGFETTQQADGGVELEYRFSGLPARGLHEWQLVYVAPTLLIDVPVEFAFENVPVAESRDESPESSDQSR